MRRGTSTGAGARVGLAAAAVILAVGCGAEEADVGAPPSAEALHSVFPEQAGAVLGQGEGFLATDRGYSLRASPGASAWLRVSAELPRDGAGAIRMRVRGFDVRVREIGAEGPGALVDRAVAYRRPGGTSYWTSAGGGVEEWLHLKGPRGEVAAAWEVEGARVEQRGESVAVLDEMGAARIWVSAPSAYGAPGRAAQAKLRAQGSRIELLVEGGGDEVLVDPLWTAVAKMHSIHRESTTARLANGHALVTGGYQVDTLEVFDPEKNEWSWYGQKAARGAAASALLPDGQVMTVGGFNGATLNTAEVAPGEAWEEEA